MFLKIRLKYHLLQEIIFEQSPLQLNTLYLSISIIYHS